MKFPACAVLFGFSMMLGQVPPRQLPPTLEQLVQGSFPDDIYRRNPDLYRKPQNVDKLLAMLNDEKYLRYRWNVVNLLGLMGDARAVDPLIKVLERGAKNHRDGVAYRYPIPSGLFALGKIYCRTKNQKAFHYLVSALEPSFWLHKVPAPHGPRLHESVVMNEVLWAIRALGHCGDQKGKGALLAFRKKMMASGDVHLLNLDGLINNFTGNYPSPGR